MAGWLAWQGGSPGRVARLAGASLADGARQGGSRGTQHTHPPVNSSIQPFLSTNLILQSNPSYKPIQSFNPIHHRRGSKRTYSFHRVRKTYGDFIVFGLWASPDPLGPNFRENRRGSKWPHSFHLVKVISSFLASRRPLTQLHPIFDDSGISGISCTSGISRISKI